MDFISPLLMFNIHWVKFANKVHRRSKKRGLLVLNSVEFGLWQISFEIVIMKKRTEISQEIFQLNMKSRPPIWIHMWLDSLLCSHVMQQIFCWANLQWNCPWGQKHVETQRDRGAKLTRTTSWLVSQGVPPIPEE